MKKLICYIAGHRFFVKQRFSSYTSCLGCKWCGSFFAMNDDVKVVVPWNILFTELHEYSAFVNEG